MHRLYTVYAFLQARRGWSKEECFSSETLHFAMTGPSGVLAGSIHKVSQFIAFCLIWCGLLRLIYGIAHVYGICRFCDRSCAWVSSLSHETTINSQAMSVNKITFSITRSSGELTLWSICCSLATHIILTPAVNFTLFSCRRLNVNNCSLY